MQGQGKVWCSNPRCADRLECILAKLACHAIFVIGSKRLRTQSSTIACKAKNLIKQQGIELLYEKIVGRIQWWRLL
jgi:hypothetical protein